MKKSNEKLDLKIYEAMLLVDRSTPEIFPILNNCKIFTDENHPSASIGISKRGHIEMTIKADWVEKFNTYNLAALIEHETLHLVLSHLTDAKNTMPDARLANIAQDSIINSIGKFFRDKSKLNTELKNGVYLEKINAMLGANFTAEKNTAKEIYDALIKEAENKNKNGNGKPQNDKAGNEKTESDQSENGQGLESFDMGVSELEGDSENDAATNAQKNVSEQALDEAAQSIMQNIASNVAESLALDSESLESFAMTYGSQSADLKIFAEKLAKLKKDTIVNAALSRFIASCIRGKISTIKKPSRRFPSLPYGRKNDKQSRLLMAIDTSGSMLDEYTLEKMSYCLSTAVQAGYDVDLIAGDTRKHGETYKSIKNGFDMTQLGGGGGTCMAFIFEEKLTDYDGIVVVTDGYWNHNVIPTKQRQKLLFLLTEKVAIEGFKCVNLK